MDEIRVEGKHVLEWIKSELKENVFDKPEYIDTKSRNICSTNRRFGALHHHQCN